MQESLSKELLRLSHSLETVVRHALSAELALTNNYRTPLGNPAHWQGSTLALTFQGCQPCDGAHGASEDITHGLRRHELPPCGWPWASELV